MKTLPLLLGVLVVVAGLGGFVYYNSMKSQAEDDALNADIFDPNAIPTGEPLSRSDLANLVVYTASRYVGEPNNETVPMNYNVIVVNGSQKIINSVRVRISIDSGYAQPFVTEALLKSFPPLNPYHNSYMVLPGIAAWSEAQIQVPLDYWTYGSVTTYEVIEATALDPKADLHDGDHLLAYMLMAETADVIKAFEADPSLYNVVSSYRLPPVLMACGQADPAMIQHFIDKGQDVKLRGSTDINGLHLAASLGSPEVVKFLVEKGVDINAQDNAGKTPLYWACEMNNDFRVKALLDNGADPEVRDKGGRTPLLMAAQNGNLDALITLIDSGANRGARDKDGFHAMHLAAAGGRYNIITHLVNKGVSLDVKNPINGWTPLHYAVRNAGTATVQHLIELGADTTARTADGTDLYGIVKLKSNATDQRFMEQALEEAGVKRPN